MSCDCVCVHHIFKTTHMVIETNITCVPPLVSSCEVYANCTVPMAFWEANLDQWPAATTTMSFCHYPWPDIMVGNATGFPARCQPLATLVITMRLNEQVGQAVPPVSLDTAEIMVTECCSGGYTTDLDLVSLHVMTESLLAFYETNDAVRFCNWSRPEAPWTVAEVEYTAAMAFFGGISLFILAGVSYLVLQQYVRCIRSCRGNLKTKQHRMLASLVRQRHSCFDVLTPVELIEDQEEEEEKV